MYCHLRIPPLNILLFQSIRLFHIIEADFEKGDIGGEGSFDAFVGVVELAGVVEFVVEYLIHTLIPKRRMKTKLSALECLHRKIQIILSKIIPTITGHDSKTIVSFAHFAYENWLIGQFFGEGRPTGDVDVGVGEF